MWAGAGWASGRVPGRIWVIQIGLNRVVRVTNTQELLRDDLKGQSALPVSAAGHSKSGKARSTGNRVIMVVDESTERSCRLKSLIEFMDAPSVRTADPSCWHERLADDSLAAVFVRRDLPDEIMRELLQDIGQFDPNVPIVLVDGQRDA